MSITKKNACVCSSIFLYVYTQYSTLNFSEVWSDVNFHYTVITLMIIGPEEKLD